MVDIRIERMGEKGDGLAQGRSFAHTLPGEYVDQQGRVSMPSAQRIKAFCPAFGTCGGCKLQHWQPDAYREWKRGLLTTALAARGLKTDVKLLLDVHGEGRRRVALHVQRIENKWHAGFMAEGSHTLVPIVHCPILVPKLQALPELAARFGSDFGPCDVMATMADNGIDIAIKATRKMADKAVVQYDGLMRQHGIIRIAVNGETLTQLTPPVITFGKARVALSVAPFLQATLKGEAVLAQLLEEALGKTSKPMADLFCGLGPFTLCLSQRRAVTGYDSSRPAIASLNSAIRHTPGLKPVQALVRDLFQHPLTLPELREFDAVVLNPPRAGAEAQCNILAKSQVKRLAYVSCALQSLARDALILVQGGYRMKYVTPVDQFKYSPHLECVAVFEQGA